MQAFIHISTAYTSGETLHRNEEIYPPKYDPEEIIDLVKTCSSDEMEKVSNI
jgi:hypothetical protein